MSLITRCPACQTLFKVVPDQLRISEGWVRCGVCEEVFDGAFHLVTADVLADETEVRPAAPELPLAENEPQVELSSQASEFIPDAFQVATSDVVVSEQEPEAEVNSQEDPEIASLAFKSSDLDPVIQPALLTDDAPHVTVLPEDEEAAPDTDHVHVSFLQSNEGHAFWRRPLVRATFFALSLLLLISLAGQIVFYERNRIAASYPSLKPGLLALCKSLTCDLSPLQHIESILIDSSSFTKIRGDVYQLSFALKNSDPTALATPAIELTLTDTLDQPVFRRVLLHSEFGEKLGALNAGSEWMASLPVALESGGMASRVSGYRLLAFYP